MQKTNISWTDFSANLLKYRDVQDETVWACVKTSAGCAACYAESLAKRWGRGAAFTAENTKKLTPYFDEKEAAEILRSKKIAGKKVFVDDMTDLFGEWVSDAIIIEHFKVFAQRPDVTFQVLTKRAKRVEEISKDIPGLLDWPNVHVGVSVEDQKTFNERWEHLREANVMMRWLSIEPLLGEIEMQSEIWERCDEFVWPDWCVVGGESGAGHRTMPLEAALNIIDVLRSAHIPVWVKQDSGPRPGMQGRIPDNYWLKQFPKAA